MQEVRASKHTVNRVGLEETLTALLDAVKAQGLQLGADGWHSDAPIDGKTWDKVHDWIHERWSSRKGGWRPGLGSYRLKHICESEIEGGYCDNGTFIAACLFEGFTAFVEPGNLNCTFSDSPIEE